MSAPGNADIRRRALVLRDGLPEEYRAEASERICGRLFSLYHDHSAAVPVYLAYRAIRSEVDILRFCEKKGLLGEAFYYPVVSGEEMDFYRAAPDSAFVRGAFGCLEPTDHSQPLGADEPAVALVPGVAFSPLGDRLGYGKGYFDRFLAAHPNIRRKIGICFEAQLFDGIVPSATDVPMDVIVTEERWIEVGLR